MHNKLLIALVAGLAGAAALTAAVLGGSPPLWRLPLLLAGAAAVLLLLRSPHLGWGLAAALRAARSPLFQWAVLGVAAVALATRSFGHGEVARPGPKAALRPYRIVSPPPPPHIPLVEVPAAHAVTDAGRPVPLRRPREAGLKELTEIVAAAEKVGIEAGGFAESVIRLTPPEPSCNCHGWVFAGGRYWIDGPEVERILHDNGYAPVSKPATGDLVVYRDDEGEVLHTGIVRADCGEEVLVESKWGGGGRFVHALDGHFDRGRGEFYRSGREGHLLDGLDEDGP